MKIKMKLFLLCAAVAPFLMMNSGQQIESSFGCVCALEKGNSNDPNENAPAPAPDLFDEEPPSDLWDMFIQNKEILKQYASDNKTLDYSHFERIVGFLAKDKGDSIENFKNKLEKKAVIWLDFCFLSAILEGLLAFRDQNFESIEHTHTFKKDFPTDFPFAELKELTRSMWTQLESIEFIFRPNGFYHSLFYLMRCRSSEFVDFIVGLAKVRPPYMQLFIACLMNFAYDIKCGVAFCDWYDLINIMNKCPDRLDDEDVVASFISCFHFESNVKQALLNYYSDVLMPKYSSSADILYKLARLNSSFFV